MLRSSLALALAAALAGPAPATRPTPGLDAARSFVSDLYAGYAHGAPDYLGKGADRVFSTRLLGLIRADQKATPDGDVGALDGDPICDCQDQQITDVAVEATPLSPGHVRARVRFRNFGRPQDLTLDLALGRRGWRVDDVHSRETPSLTTLLRHSRTPAVPRR